MKPQHSSGATSFAKQACDVGRHVKRRASLQKEADEAGAIRVEVGGVPASKVALQDFQQSSLELDSSLERSQRRLLFMVGTVQVQQKTIIPV